MLYNRPPQGSQQIPGFTTASSNQQTVPQFSAAGNPALQTAPGGFVQAPSFTSSTVAPSGSNFNQSVNPAAGYNPLAGNAPLDVKSGNMLSTPPPSNTGPSMGSYFNSSNPSTLMRSTVGNTTQSGAL